MKINKQSIFLILLVAMVFLAGLLPYQQSNSFIDLGLCIDWGITLIFFLYGLKLNLKELIKDLMNWKLHLLIQCSTFVLFPLIVLIFKPIFPEGNWTLVWLSLFFLAALPSTVSSSVVMVSVAKGNIISAIFNATISGLLGILLTPFLLGLFVTMSGEVESNGMLLELCLKVLFPLIIGLLLNKYLKNRITKYKNWIAEFDKFVILLIVYESFTKAFLAGVFTQFSPIYFVVIALGSVGLFFMVFGVLYFVTEKLKFKYEDKVTTLFCGSKKSLVHGSVFLSLLALNPEAKILFLLPIMLYHSFQLFFVSWLAQKWGSGRS